MSEQQRPSFERVWKDGFEVVDVRSAEEWSKWLAHNQARDRGVWVLFYKKDSGIDSLTYDQAVDEAICWGWIDSKINKRDALSWVQYFAPRNPKSKWSRVNQAKVERLRAENRMEEPGLRCVELAMQTGTWEALNEVEDLVVPVDLAEAFEEYPAARTHFDAFSKSSKRAILEWILNAKKPETRQKRIAETARLAASNQKANHPKSNT